MSTPNYLYFQALAKIDALTTQLAAKQAELEALQERMDRLIEGRRFILVQLLMDKLASKIDFSINPEENDEIVQLKAYIDFLCACTSEMDSTTSI